MVIKLLIGGSPCTRWSIAQSKEKRETTTEGLGWELFKNYLIAKDKFKPDYFLYENNVSTAKAIKEMISETLGVGSDEKTRFTEIDSSLVSAQRRKRFYVTNFGEIKQPNDRNISLESILQSGTVDRQKSLCLTRRYAGFEGSQSYLRRRYFGKSMGQAVFENTTAEQQKEIWKQDPYQEIETEGAIRALTPIECERLQTLPDDYTKAVSERWRKECIGNGWIAEVIIYLLNHALSDVPRDEEIIVFSLYDGIATGRYCLDKMGFTNVTYYAYEIDKHAISVAMDNYPDIIQCGDAFAVHEEDWKPPQTRSKWLDGLLGGG